MLPKCFQAESGGCSQIVGVSQTCSQNVLPEVLPKTAPKSWGSCSQIVGVSQRVFKRAPRRAPRIVGVQNVLPDVLPESWGSPSVHLSFAALTRPHCSRGEVVGGSSSADLERWF